MTDEGNFGATDPIIHPGVHNDARASVSPDSVIETMLRALPDPVFVIDRQGRYLYVGEAAIRRLGKPASDFIGKTVRDMGFSPEVAANLTAQTEQVLRTGQSAISTDPIPTIDGPRWYEHRYSPMFDAEGHPVAMLCIARDVTERMLLEAERTRRQDVQAAQREMHDALREQQERYRLMVENAQEGIWLIGPDATTEYVNPWLCQMLGYPPEEMIGHNAFDFLFPEDLPLQQNNFARRKMGVAEQLEVRWRRKNGTELWTLASSNPFLDEQGRFIGALALITDLTERKQAEQALRLATERFELALQGSSIMVFHQDLDLRFTWIYNPSFGYNAADVIGKRDSDLVERRDDATVTEAIKREVIHTGIRQRQEVQVSVAGVERCYDLLVDPLRDNTGHIIGVTCAAVDITERKLHQKEIVDLNVRLQRSITEAHHRIKNNLQVLNAMVDMQVADGKQTVPAAELTRLGQHIRTLAAIHDLLTLDSRVGTNRDAISLKATLEKMAVMLQVAGGGRKLTLRADDLLVSLKQAGAFAMLVNELVSNALKHGRGDIEVSVTSVSDPGATSEPGRRSARLEVCDDGPGFPAGFDPQRAANTGLELIESLGRWDLRGQIVYANRAEGGARVVVTFPLDAAP